MTKFPLLLSASCFSLIVALAPAAAKADTDINGLEKRLDQQDKLISDQQSAITEQAKQIEEQKKMINALLKESKKKSQVSTTTDGSNVSDNKALHPKKAKSPQQQQAEQAVRSNTPPTAEPVEEPERPQIDMLAGQGGVLSPKGSLAFESTTEYTNTTRNLFTFNGVQLSQVVFVGVTNNTSARHQIVQQTGRLRLGITDRLEADIHAPFIYRNDALTTTNGATTIPSSVEGYNLGDIDAGLAYQLNDGNKGWPYLIGNIRYKANNADGPYDVPYDANNVATRLPVGTGFQTVEASVTAIKVSDPAVLFGNIGYVYDIPEDINKDFNGTRIGHVNPGDAVNALLGVSFAINQDTSFSLGYKHSYVFPTIQSTISSGVETNASTGSQQVGALTFGLTYAVTPTTPINFNLESGVTNDAPDVHLTMRIPFQLGKVF